MQLPQVAQVDQDKASSLKNDLLEQTISAPIDAHQRHSVNDACQSACVWF